MAKRSEVRELRLEGAGLFLIVAFLGAGLIGAFFLGRWFERSSAPPAGADRFASDPLENVVAPDEVEKIAMGANHFDTVDDETVAEPSREATRPAVRQERSIEKLEVPPADAATQKSVADSGAFYVQIAAYRDRSSADKVVSELQGAGYGVKIFTENGASGRLFKVRVGGYGSRDEAVTAAGALQTAGYPGAFPTKID